MKKYLVVLAGVALLAGVAIGVNLVKAEEEGTATSTASTVAPIVQDIKEELRQELSIKEIRGRIICQALGVCPSALASTEVLIKSAKVTEMSADLIKVSIFGYIYSIDIKNTKLVRNSWGISEIDEFSVGDIVNVFGELDESDNYLIHAKTVRNVSIQKVHNVFKGVIESIDATSTTFVLQTEERGKQTVVVSADTRIIKSQIVLMTYPPRAVEVPGSFSDLQVGMKVIVRGLWDKALSKIQARVVIIGGEENVRPFFKKIEKLEGKIEKFEGKIEKKAGESAEAIQRKIEEIQKKIAEILEKLKTATSTAQ